MNPTDQSILLRLLLALILAGVLGWEREESGKAAGLRTHMLVGMAAVLFVVLGELFVLRFGQYSKNMQFDPIRIVEAVVTGISFLGAGSIFVTQGQERVKGLTTAASILATAAVGMIVGVERYTLAIGSTILVFVVLRVVNLLEAGLAKKGNRERN
jgi:putative Mg2+ transporter-C (MgtC) family protein